MLDIKFIRKNAEPLYASPVMWIGSLAFGQGRSTKA